MNNLLFLTLGVLCTVVMTGCTQQNAMPTNTVPTQENKTIPQPSLDTTEKNGERFVIQVSHDGLQFVPSVIQLAQGKQYRIEVTPTSDGKGCMTEVVIPGKGPHAIKKGEMFTIDVDGTTPQVIPLVCSAMGMKQGEIVVQ